MCQARFYTRYCCGKGRNSPCSPRVSLLMRRQEHQRHKQHKSKMADRSIADDGWRKRVDRGDTIKDDREAHLVVCLCHRHVFTEVQPRKAFLPWKDDTNVSLA